MKRIFASTTALVVFILLMGIGTYRFSWRVRHDVDIIRRIDWIDISVCYYPDGQEVSFQSEGLSIRGDLHPAESEDRNPGIVLIHGSTPWGRKLPLHRLMAKRLSERGYVVLRIDVRGFGDSDDPLSLHDPGALDGTQDVINATTFLTTLPDVDENRVYLLGHSLGATLAINAGIQDGRVRKIVAIGPGRRIRERIENELTEFRERYSQDRNFSGMVPADVFLELAVSLNIDNAREYFAEEGHKPLFLIDGQLEGRRDRRYLQDYYRQMVPPKKYLTVQGCGHYLNTANFLLAGISSACIVYDKRVIEEVVEEIDCWLRQDSPM